MKDQQQITAAKAAAKQKALARSEQGQVTNRPPNLYQIPHINVPKDLAECARLIHLEFSRIAASQSIMLTLWEENEEKKTTIAKLENRIKLLEMRAAADDRQD